MQLVGHRIGLEDARGYGGQTDDAARDAATQVNAPAQVIETQRLREEQEQAAKLARAKEDAVNNIHRLGIDNLGQMFGEDAVAQKRYRKALASSADARETAARAANQAWFLHWQPDAAEAVKLGWHAVKPLIAEAYYGRDAATEGNELSDVELYEALAKQANERDARDEFARGSLDFAVRAALKVRDEESARASREARESVLGKDTEPKREWAKGWLGAWQQFKEEKLTASGHSFGASQLDSMRSQFRAAYQRAEMESSRYRDTADAMLRVLARETGAGWLGKRGDESDNYSREWVFERLAELDEGGRQAVYEMVWAMAENAGETEVARNKGGAEKVLTRTFRQWRDIAVGHIDSFESSGIVQRLRIAEALQEFTHVDENGRVQVNDDDAARRAMNAFFNSDGRGYGVRSLEAIPAFIEKAKQDEVRYKIALEVKDVAEHGVSSTKLDNWIYDALADAPGQLAFMAQVAAGPFIGIPLIINSTKDMRTKELVRNGLSLSQADTIASASAVFEAGIEYLQADMLFRKGSFVGKLMGGKPATKGTFGELAKRGATVTGIELVSQNVQEAAQDAIPLILQDVASLFSETMPEVGSEAWAEWWATRGPTAITLAPIVAFGTGRGVFRDRKAAAKWTGHRIALEAVGYSKETVDKVIDLMAEAKMAEGEAATTKANEALDVLKKAESERKKGVGTQEQVAAMQEVLRETQEVAGLFEQYDITPREDGTFEVRDRDGDLVDTAGSLEAAMELAEQTRQSEFERDIRAEEELEAKGEVKEPVQGFELANANDTAVRPVDAMNASLSARLAALDAQRERDAKLEEREEVLGAALSAERADQRRSGLGLGAASEARVRGEEAQEKAFEEWKAAKAKGGEESDEAKGEAASSAGESAQADTSVNTEEEGMPAANRSGVLRVVPQSYVGEGRGMVVLTPDATQRRNELAAQEPVVIESNLPEDIEAAKAKAKEDYRALERKVTNQASGREIELVMRAFGKLRSHIGNQRVLKIVPHLKELIESAIPLFENTGDGKHWHHYGAAAIIDGEAFFVRLVAFEGSNNKLQLDVFHDAQVTVRDAVEGTSPLGRSRVTNADAQGQSPSKELLVQWWQLVKEKEDADAKARAELGDAGEGSNEQGSPLGLERKNKQATSFAGESGALANRKGRPVNAPEVMGAIAAVIDTVGGNSKALNRLGRIRMMRARGVYLPREKVTRIKMANNIATAAHELAHAIDGQLWNYGHWAGNALGLSDSARRELFRLGVDLYGRTKPNGGYYSEGFAEFIRLWLTDQRLAKKLAPSFAEYWEGELAKRPEFAEAIQKASDLAHAWFAQGSRNRAAGGIVPTPTNAQKLGGFAGEQWREKYKNWVESAAAIQAFTEEAIARSRSRKLDDSMNPYFTLTARRLTADAVVEYMATEGMIDFAGNKTGTAPLAEAFNLVGKGKAEDFQIYLWAKRTIALWHDRKNGPRHSGLDIADAEQIVADLESPQFIRAASIVYEWSKGVLDYAAQASPALAETVRRIRAVDPGFYIPLQREFEAFDDRYRSIGGGSAARAKLTNKLRGSSRRIKDPVESMMAQAKNIVLKAQQRRIIDQIMYIARTTDGMGHYVVEVPVDQVPRAQASVADLLTLIDSKFKQYTGKEAVALRPARSQVEAQEMANILEEATVTLFGPASEPKQGEVPIFPVWENGKVKWYELDQELYEALTGMDTYRLGPVLDLLFGRPARALRLGTTGLRAAFSLVTNPIRDLRTLHLNSQASANSGELFMSWMGTLKDSFLYAVTNGKVRDEWLDAAKRWGLEMAQPLGQDSRPTVRAARRIKNGGEWNAFSAGDWYDWIKQVLQFTELSSRVTEMKLVAKDIGWDVSQPVTEEIMHKLMQVGKRATTDFTQAGAYARAINQAVPFFNAAIQGPVAHIRALNANPRKFMMRGLAMSAFALVNWYRNKDEDWWLEMPISERYGHTYIPLPGGELLRIPRAFEADGLFMAMPEALIDAWYAEDPKAVIGWFKEWLGSVMPDFLPVPVKAIGENLANYDMFRDRPIVSRGQQDLPPAEQYGVYTSRVAITLGRIFNVSWASPYKIDHAVRSFFGGVGTDLVGLLGRGDNSVIKRDWEAADTPVFGTLFQLGGQKAGRPKSLDALHQHYQDALQKSRSRFYEETPLERQQRLMMADGVRAQMVLNHVKLNTASRDARAELEKEQIAIAREIVGLVEQGKFNRPLGNQMKTKAETKKRTQERQLREAKEAR